MIHFNKGHIITGFYHYLHATSYPTYIGMTLLIKTELLAIDKKF